MRKIFALIAIIAVTVIFRSWVWTYTYHPLLPMVVIDKICAAGGKKKIKN